MSQHNRGSSHHMLNLVCNKSRRDFTEKLTELISLPDVIVTEADWWRPDIGNTVEARTETLPEYILSGDYKTKILKWWLKIPKGANTPNWDFIGTADVKGHKGLILIEAKAHKNEISKDGKLLKSTASENSKINHEHIIKAIEKANLCLHGIDQRINIPTDRHYQLANRIAYAWKFASLGIPTVLIYLGFINDINMQDVGEPFKNSIDWNNFMINHFKSIFPDELLENEINCGKSSFRFLLRSIDILKN